MKHTNIVMGIFVVSLASWLIVQHILAYPASPSAHVINLQGQTFIEEANKSHQLSANTTIRRGSIIKTQDDGYLSLELGDVIFYLDHRTDVEVVSTQAEDIRFRMIRGRVFVTNKAKTPVRIESGPSTISIFEGSASIIRYDFLFTTELIPQKSIVGLLTNKKGSVIKTPVTIADNAAEPTEVKADTTSPDVKPFYQWVQQK